MELQGGSIRQRACALRKISARLLGIFVHEDAQKARADFAEHACALADAATLEFDEFEGNTI